MKVPEDQLDELARQLEAIPGTAVDLYRLDITEHIVLSFQNAGRDYVVIYKEGFGYRIYERLYRDGVVERMAKKCESNEFQPIVQCIWELILGPCSTRLIQRTSDHEA